MAINDNDLLREFVWSTREEIQIIEDILLRMEDGQASADDLNVLYRSFHSIKGAAGLTGLGALEQAAHQGEELLSGARKDPACASPALAGALLQFVDGCKMAMHALEQNGEEPAGAYQEFLDALDAWRSAPATSPAPTSSAGETPAATAPPADDPSSPPEARRAETLSPPAPAETVERTPPPEPKPAAAPAATNTDAPPASGGHEQVVESTIRVNTSLLDQLMNLVGELVLTRNRVLQITASEDNAALQTASQGLDQVTSELQEQVMRTRMQPIGSIFNKFPRIVRDLSRQLGKQVELEINGKDTELDRTILESMRDPFTHILRNSLDHGLETPDQRTAAGKSAQGTISISAYHEGGQVVVEVRDDGRGIDGEKVKAKALANGLITDEQAQRMSQQEAANLICHPGLSTAQEVTNISGRGVGMDVVRSNIEQIGGSLEILTEIGRGTTMRIRIPLTLAIIPALMISAGDAMFGIPQINLVELVGVDADEMNRGIETIRGAEVYRLRERLLTLVRLSDLLDLPSSDPSESADGMAYIVVVAAGEEQFGLVVGDIYDTEEIVVKPLSRHFSDLDWFAGATIRGDGSISLILDMAGIARSAEMVGNGEHTETDADRRDSGIDFSEQQDFLIFTLGNRERFAVPLQMVNRIEQYEAGTVTEVNGSPVICHNRKLTPAIHLQEFTRAKPPPEGTEQDPVFAIVLSVGDGIGLVARDILDSRPIDLTEALDQPEFLRSDVVNAYVVVDDQPTALIDVHRLVEAAFPHRAPPVPVATIPAPGQNEGSGAGVEGVEQPAQPLRILYCEDAQFFQNVVAGYLRDAGYTVTVCEHGEEGWQKLQEDIDSFDIVLTDLEMPVMDGWGLIKSIRSRPDLDHLPVIALTSLTDEEARQRTLQAGATEHVVKLQKDELLHTIARVMTPQTA